MSDPRLRKLQKRLAVYGAKLEPMGDGYGLSLGGEFIHYCADLDAVATMLMTEAEFRQEVRRTLEDLKEVTG